VTRRAGGIVRAARRPPGWIVPGPPAAGATSAVAPEAGEDLCWLAGDWRILQRLHGHRWSLDDLVTAWFAARVVADPPPRWIADLGCGIGAVLMLLAWRFSAARVVGVEAQEMSTALARRSLRWNGADGRCEVRLGDLRDPAVLPEGPVFDLVAGTPPYLRSGSATESPHTQRAPSHFEHRGGIEDYCTAAARLLARGARFVACAAAAQEGRVRTAAAAAGLGVERHVDVIPREGKPPLFAVFALRRRPEATAAAVDPPLVVRDAAGRWTPAFRSLRGDMGMPA